MTAYPKVVQITSKAEALVREYARNKHELDALVERNREIARVLAGLAEYKEGAKSGHLLAAGYKVTTTLKEGVSWDQDALEAARIKLGDAEFLKVFRWKFEPKSSKALHGFFDYAPAEAAETVKKAMVVKPAQPQVKLEKLED